VGTADILGMSEELGVLDTAEDGIFETSFVIILGISERADGLAEGLLGLIAMTIVVDIDGISDSANGLAVGLVEKVSVGLLDANADGTEEDTTLGISDNSEGLTDGAAH